MADLATLEVRIDSRKAEQNLERLEQKAKSTSRHLEGGGKGTATGQAQRQMQKQQRQVQKVAESYQAADAAAQNYWREIRKSASKVENDLKKLKQQKVSTFDQEDLRLFKKELGANETALRKLRGKIPNEQFERLQREISDSRRELNKLNRAQNKVSEGFSKMARLGGALAAGGAAATGLGYLVQRSLEATQQLTRQAERAGTTTKAIQELQFASRQLGVSQQNVTDALKEMNIRMQDFILTGAGPAKDAFKALGLEQKEVQQMSKNTDEAFMRLLGRLQQMNKSRAINLADQIFGGQGAEAVISLIKQGTDSVEDMRKKARELAITLDEKNVKASNEAYQSIKTLTSQLQSTFATALGEIAPKLQYAATGMGNWVKNNKEFLRQDLPDTLNAVGKGLGFIGGRLKNISVDLPRGIASLIYGPNTVKGRVKEQLSDLRDRLHKVTGKIEEYKKVQRGPGQLTSTMKKDLERYKKLEAKLLQQIELRHKTLQRIDKQQKENTDKTRENTDKTRENTKAQKENNKAKEKQLSTLKRISKYLQSHEDVLQAQRARAMAPPVVGPDKFGDAKSIDPSRGAVTSPGTEWVSKWQKDMNKVDSKAQDVANSMNNAFSGWANSALDDLNKFVWGAERSFDQVLKSFGQMLTKMMLKESIVKPAGKAFSGLTSSLVSSLFSSAAPGTAGYNPPALPGKASGGPVSAGGTYLVGEEGPELLHTGNQNGHITPNNQIGGGETEVNVYNNSGQQAEVKRSKKSNGGERIDVMIDRQVAQSIGKGGETAQMLETKYGLSPNLASR